MYRCKLVTDTLGDDGEPDGGMITRDADLAFAPFIGLGIGALKVANVYIQQGDRESGIEVHLTPIERRIAEAWIRHGNWRWIEA